MRMGHCKRGRSVDRHLKHMSREDLFSYQASYHIVLIFLPPGLPPLVRQLSMAAGKLSSWYMF
jgi:hypothetical protein